MAWSSHSNSTFAILWNAYTACFEKVLAQWDEGLYTAMWPTLPLPFGGLFLTMGYSRQRGKAKQAELVGMTAVAEVRTASFWLLD